MSRQHRCRFCEAERSWKKFARHARQMLRQGRKLWREVGRLAIWLLVISVAALTTLDEWMKWHYQ